jgi:cellulose synthase/poly-beta-1,6-N-acetylglucosamine synthase-like glycosyltransferase
MEQLFWLSVGVVAYVYAGYPLMLRAWAALASRPVRKCASPGDRRYPSVSVVIAARNEAARLPRRLRNLLEQNYPGPLEIIVASDGSTDHPEIAVAPYRSVRLIELPAAGKAVALNQGVAAARGEIVVFADARQQFSPDAIRALVENFDDPEVGCVTGELRLDCEIERDGSEPGIGEGVGLYWRYEKWLRRVESEIWSTLGATGAIYALRRSLWQPLPAGTLLDDVLAPMRVVLAGRRTVFEPRARAFDRAAPTASVEQRRKVRTLAGNYQILGLEPRLLLPFRNPVWLQYASHKIARLLVPWALLGVLLTSAALSFSGWIYLVALILQLGFYALAAIGWWLDRSAATGAARAEESREAEDMRSWDSVYSRRSTG